MAEKVVITVASKTPKEKGGFDITDSVGGKYAVSLKNALIADSLIVGRASEVEVASTTYGKYINSAQLFDGKPAKMHGSIEEAATSPSTPDKPKPSPVEPQTSKVIPDSKNRAFALSYAKDWTCALVQSGKKDLKGTDILIVAKVFENYLNTGEIPDSALVKEAKKLATETGKES